MARNPRRRFLEGMLLVLALALLTLAVLRMINTANEHGEGEPANSALNPPPA